MADMAGIYRGQVSHQYPLVHDGVEWLPLEDQPYPVVSLADAGPGFDHAGMPVLVVASPDSDIERPPVTPEWPAQRPQRQDSLADQLKDLHRVAARLGMYDAADWLWKAMPHGALASPPTTVAVDPWWAGDDSPATDTAEAAQSDEVEGTGAWIYDESVATGDDQP